MPKTHIVEQGECLSSIAAAHGFADWKRIYEAAENAELRRLRPNPNVLAPGDAIVIPDPRVQTLRLATGRSHKIVVKRPRVQLKVRIFQDLEARTMKAKFRLTGLGLPRTIEGELREGLLDVKLPPEVERVRLTILSDAGAVIEELDLTLGHLDPADSLAGAQMRLQRLGFDCGPVTGARNEATEYALRLFQKRYGLAEDGVLNRATVDKLRELAGA